MCTHRAQLSAPWLNMLCIIFLGLEIQKAFRAGSFKEKEKATIAKDVNMAENDNVLQKSRFFKVIFSFKIYSRRRDHLFSKGP